MRQNEVMLTLSDAITDWGCYAKIERGHSPQSVKRRKGDCWDNAPMESFFGTLKKELVHHQKYRTREDARRDIFEYIEVFYAR